MWGSALFSFGEPRCIKKMFDLNDTLEASWAALEYLEPDYVDGLEFQVPHLIQKSSRRFWKINRKLDRWLNAVCKG
jgi:hypothetical protein